MPDEEEDTCGRHQGREPRASAEHEREWLGI